MPRQAAADWNAADRAPEYPPGAGHKVSTDEHPVVETATEARQAVTGQGNGVVLAISTIGVIVAFVILYVLFFS